MPLDALDAGTVTVILLYGLIALKHRPERQYRYSEGFTDAFRGEYDPIKFQQGGRDYQDGFRKGQTYRKP